MKITIISHDVWGFGKHIHLELEKLNHKSTYINCMKFSYNYTNILNRIGNFFSKVFLNKNIKKIHRTKKIIETIANLPFQDYILVINSGDFNPSVFELIKAKTTKLITYNYDRILRVPLTPNATEIFDEIYSFDTEDVKNNPHFIKTNNFIYKEKQALKDTFSTKAFIILSKDKMRNKVLSKIADQFDKNGFEENYEFIIIGNKTNNLNKNLIFQNKKIPHIEVLSKIENTEIMIDIVRKKQTGLSFRVFESLAYQKKLIINNPNIKNYVFYNPNNILVIDENNPQILPNFLETKYEPLEESIYQQFTINAWVETVFELN
jgi:hypothetical protein